MIKESSQFYKNIQDKPYWNDKKDYYGQSRDAQQFMDAEAEKITNGLTINGVRIHPWLYWHTNFWTMLVDYKVPGEDLPRSKHSEADLRDNEWLLQQALIRSEKENKGIVGFGARRLGKSAFISSFVGHSATTKFGGELRVNAVVGGSQEDLDNITGYIGYGLDNLPSFFKMDRVGKDWAKGVTLGTRNTDNSKEIFSTTTVTNISRGAITSSQKTAGATPLTSIWDEIGKFSFMKAFNAFKYSIATEYGWRTTPLLFGCLTENNKVWTSLGDLIPIKDLKKSDGIVGYDKNTGQYSIEPITHQQSNYKKECIKITTSAGKVIECSFDHPILTKFRNRSKYDKKTKSSKRLVEFLEASKLKIGDTICTIDQLPIFGNENVDNSRFLGLLIGDGTYGKNTTPRISNCDKVVIDYVKSLYETKIEDSYTTKDGRDFYTLRILGSGKFLREAGIFGQVKTKKTLPLNTFRLNKESLSNLLGGLYDADGHVCFNDKTKAGTIGLTFSHKELLDEVINCLLKFGIHGTINFHPGTESGFGKGEGCYVLTINDFNSIIRFKENISFLIQYKQENLDKLYLNAVTKINSGCKTSLQKTLTHTGIRSERIVSIENIGEQLVYNLTADKTNTYLSGAIITHNTGGVVEFSRDAQKMVNNPTAYNMITMDWSQIGEDGMVKPWVERDWGVFMPGQMSLDSGVPKQSIPLSTFLGVDPTGFEGVTIKVTQWKESTDLIRARREELKKTDMAAYNDEVMFIPLDPDDCFLDGGKNPFPVAEGNRHLIKIRAAQDTGRLMDVFPYKDNSGKVELGYSKKEIAPYPFTGGILDCGVKIFEDPPEDNSFDYTFVAGLDHYKHTESTGDSLGSLYIMKRMVNINDEFSNSIVCSYVARPPSMNTFNRTCEILLDAYGAQCLQENADISFQQFLEAKGKDIKLLANGQEVVQRMISSSSRQTNKYGLSPTVKNKEYYFGLVVAYCWEETEAYINSEGEEVKILGIERIKDEELLMEILDYSPAKNVDRIVAFGHALVWGRYLDDIRVVPPVKGQPKRKPINKETYEMKRSETQNKVRNRYGRGRSSRYGR